MAGKELMNINLDMLVEMVEKQLLLSEDNTQNIYKTTVKLRVNRERAGETTQVLNEIRGIKGVTTVIHLSGQARKADTYDFVFYEIKYELIGRDTNPVSYIKKILVPGIREIQGVEIQDINPRPEKLS
jgi:hypothetical protein|tara:strand:- start:193 stop:576 length:384 start_codon:yes stop_codon:yes gene_type:complete